MSRLRFVAAVGLTLVVFGCSPTPATPLLTDPREIMVTAIRATSSLAYVRLHADLKVSTVGAVAPGGGDVQLSLDVDMDVLHRLRAGRVATQMTGGLPGQARQAANVNEFITLLDASYSRAAGAVRWTKISTGLGGDPGGPTNAEFGSIQFLLSKPGVKLELGEAAPCSLGTCYHVIATADGDVALRAIDAAMGESSGDNGRIGMPTLVFDVLVDQATGLLSEVRFDATMQGTSNQIAVVFSNPNLVLQIVAPPPELIDVGFGEGNLGGGQVAAPTPQVAPRP